MIFPREIEYFIRIVEDGNLSNAADTLCISQPALSKYLSKLENDIGAQLVVRKGSSLSLTDSGRAYYKAAKEIHATLKAVEREIDDFKDVGPKRLCIGTTGDRAQIRISEFMMPLFDEFPELKVKVIEGSRPEIIRKIKTGEIEIGFFSYYESDPELEQIELYSTAIQLAVGKNHPLSSVLNVGKPVDINTLEKERFVLPGTMTVFRKRIDEHLRKECLRLNVAIETKSKYAAISYVENGAAIGFFPKHFYIKPENINYYDLKVPFYVQGSLTYRKGSYLTKQTKRFIELAKEYYTSLEESYHKGE